MERRSRQDREARARVLEPPEPDVDAPLPDVVDDRVVRQLRAKHEHLRPTDIRPMPPEGPVEPRQAVPPAWNSVALFFNLVESRRPDEYRHTDADAVRDWLDEGDDPASPPISQFVQNYWRTVSYGHLNFGMDVPRNSNGEPLIPTLDADTAASHAWRNIVELCVEANAEPIWRASGGLTKNNKRWIPSVVLVENYKTSASADFRGWTQTVNGVDYEIGDRFHIRYSLELLELDGVQTTARRRWGTLLHEYGHNFLEEADLYGPAGCTGYWDLLGDNTPAFRTSEICSVFKERVGWIEWKEVIEGPKQSPVDRSLRPYTLTGEAYKIVPDPQHTPHEYFVLEYRKSTGQEAWRPDGALQEEGLLITHINERLGIPRTWLAREAPYFDPEFADYRDSGAALWTGHDELDGVVHPRGDNNEFTHRSRPSSLLYGPRRSGLSITNIRIENGQVAFRVEINGNPRVGWRFADSNRAMVGDFTGAGDAGQQLVVRSANALGLVAEGQAQFYLVSRQTGWIGGWNLGRDNRELVADLDGDGRDEIFIRSPNWAGVLKWVSRVEGFDALTVQEDWIGGWNLGRDNRELVADLDGDGRDEIFIRSPNWAGVLALEGDKLVARSVQEDWIGEWNLGRDNREYVGRFTQPDRDEILMRSPNWIGLLRWDDRREQLVLASIQEGWVGGWNLGRDNRHTVADLDGDGLDEVYIRSPEWAGVLKWRNGGFQMLWIQEGKIEPLPDANAKAGVELHRTDRSYPGRFRRDRDGILHRSEELGRLAVLVWEGDEMRGARHLDSPLRGRWEMSTKDRYVIGSFHRKGVDVGNPDLDYISDDTASAFIYSAKGSAAVGVNDLTFVNTRGQESEKYELDLTWVSGRSLMTR